MTDEAASESFTRQKRGGPRFLAFVAILGVLFVVIPAVDGVLAPDYNAEAARIRGGLAEAETKTAFRDVVENAGLMCREVDEPPLTRVTCRRTDGLHVWNWTSFLQRVPDGVVARGEFAGDQKVADYRVTVERIDTP